MRARVALLIAAVAVVGIVTPVAPGGAPMGPPMSTLDKGQWSVGLDYGREEADLDASGTRISRFGIESSDTQAFTLNDIQSNMFFVNFAYGLWEDWDLFVRLGAADAKDDVTARGNSPAFLDEPVSFDGSYGFAGGLGTRATFGRPGPWRLGALLQATWFDPGDYDIPPAGILGPESYLLAGGRVNLEYWQVQFSLSALYETGAWHFWVGPLLQVTGGDLSLTKTYVGGLAGTGGQISCTADLDDDLHVGAHFGAAWDVTTAWGLWAEGQITDDLWLMGIGAAFTPGKASQP